jgi:excisionase family DNA binding protein
MINTNFLSISEVAQELSLTRNDVKKLIDDGKISAYKFGEELRINDIQLKNFIKKSIIEAEMNDYEIASKFLFSTLTLMSEDGKDLTDARAEVARIHPDWAVSYENCKADLLNGEKSHSASKSKQGDCIEQSAPTTVSSTINPADALQKLIDLKRDANPKLSYTEAFLQVQKENRDITIAYQKTMRLSQ